MEKNNVPDDLSEPAGQESQKSRFQRLGRRSMVNSGIGWNMVADILTGTFLWGGVGYLIDRWAGTDPWFMIGGFIIGHAMGIYAAMLHMKRMQRTERRHGSTFLDPGDQPGP